MSNHSNRTSLVTVRLPNDVIETIKRRCDKNGMSPGEYLRNRITYDVRRKHLKGVQLKFL